MRSAASLRPFEWCGSALSAVSSTGARLREDDPRSTAQQLGARRERRPHHELRAVHPGTLARPLFRMGCRAGALQHIGLRWLGAEGLL